MSLIIGGGGGPTAPPQHKPPVPPPASTATASSSEMSAFKAVGSQLAVTAGKSHDSDRREIRNN